MKDNTLYVLVGDNNWAAIGRRTLRNKFKYRVLAQLGGVNHTVPPGYYKFEVKVKRFKLEVSLTPTDAF